MQYLSVVEYHTYTRVLYHPCCNAEWGLKLGLTATAPSNDRSKAYTVDRSCSGTMSANIALLFGPHL